MYLAYVQADGRMTDNGQGVIAIAQSWAKGSGELKMTDEICH